MAYWFLVLGGALSFAGMLFHGLIGGKIYSSNISKSDLEPLGKTLSHFSWQFHSIHLFVCAVTLVYIAYNPEHAVATYPLIGINALGALLFFGLGLADRELMKMPGAILMGGIAALAWLGIQ
jgi:hypothetical protein